jgi:hypothetical protein
MTRDEYQNKAIELLEALYYCNPDGYYLTALLQLLNNNWEIDGGAYILSKSNGFIFVTIEGIKEQGGYDLIKKTYS